MTSSRKHALFLRKWKVSEVWWGLGVYSSSSQGSPLPDSPPKRGPDWGENVFCGSLSLTLHPPYPKPSETGKSWGEAVSPRGRGREIMTQGMERSARSDAWLEMAGACCVIPVFSSPLPPQASRFPFLL